MKSIYKGLDRCYNIVNASDCRERTELNRKERRGKAMKRIEEQYNEYIKIIIEKSTGRADVTVKTNDGNIYYYVTKEGKGWLLKRCDDGFCYNAENVALYKTLKMALEFIHLVCEDLTEHYKAVEEAEAEYRTYKGYTITGNERTGFVAFAPYGYYSGKIYKTESEAIEDIENDIMSYAPHAEDDEPAEAVEKAHTILSDPDIELDVRVSVMKSAFNSYFGKQVVDEELNIVKTEINGFHVSGCIVETGDMCLSCDIYAQDLDKTESYLAYAVGNNYAIYNQITLVNLGLYEGIAEVKAFFASRVRELSHETISLLY